MPVTIEKFVQAIEKIAPRELAYDWDNSGLLLRCKDSASRVMIALDATADVVDEAVREGCDFLLVHHPLIFAPIKTLSFDHPTDAVLMRLIREGISLYAAHTTFDRAQGGINDTLGAKLGLKDVRTVQGPGEALMRIGQLPKNYDDEAFITLVKTVLGVATIRASCAQCGKISSVAMVGGSGGDFVQAAKNEGAQALLTGEAKHHHHIEAAACDLLIIEAGHYETECVFVERIFMSLQSWLNEVQLELGLKKAKCEKAPYICR